MGSEYNYNVTKVGGKNLKKKTAERGQTKDDEPKGCAADGDYL